MSIQISVCKDVKSRTIAFQFSLSGIQITRVSKYFMEIFYNKPSRLICKLNSKLTHTDIT